VIRLGRKINVGYRNGLALNNLPFEVGGITHSLATAPVWTKEMIEARTEAMVKLLSEANKLPGELAGTPCIPWLNDSGRCLQSARLDESGNVTVSNCIESYR
jgi:hypothetical protein